MRRGGGSNGDRNQLAILGKAVAGNEENVVCGCLRVVRIKDKLTRAICVVCES